METILLLVTANKWISEDREAKAVAAVEASKKQVEPAALGISQSSILTDCVTPVILQPKYSKIVLNAWDFTITSSDVSVSLDLSPTLPSC